MMDLTEKKGLIMNVIRLGMDLPSAFLLAECSLEEQQQIEAEPSFTMQVRFAEKMLEKNILDRFHNAMMGNLMQGNTADARWFLERTNRERFGSAVAKEASGGGGEQNVHVYIPDNKRDIA